MTIARAECSDCGSPTTNVIKERCDDCEERRAIKNEAGVPEEPAAKEEEEMPWEKYLRNKRKESGNANR